MKFIFITLLLLLPTYIKSQVSSDSYILYFEKEIQEILLNIDNKKKSKIVISSVGGDVKLFQKKKHIFKDKVSYFYLNDSIIIENNPKYNYHEFWVVRKSKIHYFDTTKNKTFELSNKNNYQVNDSLNFRIINSQLGSNRYLETYEFDKQKRLKSFSKIINDTSGYINKYTYIDSLGSYYVKNYSIKNSDTIDLNSTDFYTFNQDSSHYSRKSYRTLTYVSVQNNIVTKCWKEHKEYQYNNSRNLSRAYFYYDLDKRRSTTFVDLKIKYKKLKPKDLKKIKFNPS